MLARKMYGLLRKDSGSAPKSSPTTPTRFTRVKKLAAREKYVAAPPTVRSTRPKGVSIASNATDPTTRRDIGSPYESQMLICASQNTFPQSARASSSLPAERDANLSPAHARAPSRTY